MFKEKKEAILWLQKKRCLSQNGSYWEKVYEKAIDLAISPKATRKINAYLKANLVRDAKRILRRKSNDFENFSEDTISLILPEYNSKFEIPSRYSDNADRNLLLVDLEFWLTKKIEVVHPLAKQILSGIMDGYSVREISNDLSVSMSLVKKIRKSIKVLALNQSLN